MTEEQEQPTVAEDAEPSWSPAAPASTALPDAIAASDNATPAAAPALAATSATEVPVDAQVTALQSRLVELEQQLTKEREAATDYMNRWQRAQADFANFKRRNQAEQEQREGLLAGRIVATLLPALDSFERAFATVPATLRGFSWIDGIALVQLQLHNAMAAHGVVALDVAVGEAFDPMRHESIGEVETSEQPAGHVATVLQRGYEAKGLLLRPALVQLARAPQAGASAADANATATAVPAETVEASAAPPTDGGAAPVG